MRSLLFASLLAACGEEPAGVGVVYDASEALPDDVVAPPGLTLAATPFVPGQLLTLQATGAPPGTSVWFVRSPTTGVFCPPALGGTCVGLTNPSVVGTAVANPQGVATLTLTPPVTTPVGVVMRFQAAVVNPATVSNIAALTASSVCGDGLLQTDEDCDDGNLVVGDGCDDVCALEAGQDSFRVTLVSADISANAPNGNVWDTFALIPPFTNPDVFVEIAVNNVVVGRTITIDDTIHPTWNAATVLDIFPGDSLRLTLYDAEPIGQLNDLIRGFTLTRTDLDNLRNAGPSVVSGGPVRRFTIEVTDP